MQPATAPEPLDDLLGGPPGLPIGDNPTSGDRSTGYRRMGRAYETVRMRTTQPEKWKQMLNLAARAHLEGRTWREVSELSGIPYNTIENWRRSPNSRRSKEWRDATEQAAREMAAEDAEKQVPIPAAPVRVDASAFKTAEELCDAHSLQLAAQLVERALDPRESSKNKVDAAKHALALGGHSPVTKSVVIAAPLNDPRIAQGIVGVLQELKGVESDAPVLLEQFTGDAIDAHFQEEAHA